MRHLNPQGDKAAAQMDVNPPPKLLAGVMDEPTWTKKKQMLDYFRSTIRLGKLSNVVKHWYQLEALLGFEGAVRISMQLTVQFTH